MVVPVSLADHCIRIHWLGKTFSPTPVLSPFAVGEQPSRQSLTPPLSGGIVGEASQSAIDPDYLTHENRKLVDEEYEAWKEVQEFYHQLMRDLRVRYTVPGKRQRAPIQKPPRAHTSRGLFGGRNVSVY